MKKYTILVLLILAQRSGRSQGNPADITPLLAQLVQSKPDTQRLNIYIKLAGCYIVPGRSINRMDSVAFYLKKAQELNKAFQIPTLRNKIDLIFALYHCLLFSSDDPTTAFLPVIDNCKRTGDKLNEALAWMYLGSMMDEDIQSNSFKLTCYQNGQALAQQIGDSFMEIRFEGLIAYSHVLQNKFNQAEHELSLVLQKAQEADSVTMMYTYDVLTFLYLSKGELNKGLQYALKTQQMMGITGDSTAASSFYLRLTSIYSALGNFTEASEWASKNLEFMLATENIPGVYSNIDHLCDWMRIAGNPGDVLGFILSKIRQQKPTGINDQRKVQEALGDAYNYLKMYDLAEKNYLEMIRLGKLQTYNFSISDKGFENYKMGRFYFDRGFYNKAHPFLDSSVKNYETYGVLPYQRFNHFLLFQTDSALGNYVDAIRHLEEFNRIGDSIFNTERNGQIEELQLAYQTAQKDKSFGLLEEKEKLDRVQLQHTQSIRNWIIVGAAMLLIIIGLLFRQGHLREKNNNVINIKNRQLQHYLTEKEWLLKEIHHRVKNNLQIVISLLNSQSAYIDNDTALTAINDSQHRVHAMSLIHQKLYGSENVTSIDMSSYIRELASYLHDSFNTGQHIRFEYNIMPLKLDVSQAVPLGLILNEAITNSIKYAFPDNRDGTISISLSNTAVSHYSLVISDNGIGIPVNFKDKKPGTLGMSLMAGLSEDLDGNFSIENSNGTTIKIPFLYDQGIKQPGILVS